MPPEQQTQELNATAPAQEAGAAPAGDEGTGGAKAPESAPPAAAKPAEKPAGAEAGDESKAKGAEPPTIAGGADVETEDKAKAEAEEKARPKSYWPEDWREKMAEHASAGDKKAYARELKRLQRFTDPTSVYGFAREYEGKFDRGGLIKVPGKDAKPEEIKEYQKAIGWTEKPEEMFAEIKLENGAVLGEADKPVLGAFLQAVHGATTAQDFVSKATNWYFTQQETQAAEMDAADDDFRRDAERSLKDEFGPTFNRMINATPALFATMPGGSDAKNPGSFYARLLGGRMADGKMIGNDPDFNRFLIGLAQEINPAATVVEDGNQSGMSIDAEIASLEGRMRNDRQAYFKDEKAQARYRELVTARDKIRARA